MFLCEWHIRLQLKVCEDFTTYIYFYYKQNKGALSMINTDINTDTDILINSPNQYQSIPYFMPFTLERNDKE